MTDRTESTCRGGSVQYRYHDVIHLDLCKVPTRLVISRLDHRAPRSWLLIRGRAEDVDAEVQEREE